MDQEIIQAICMRHFSMPHTYIKRFSTGLGNYVFLVQVGPQRYVLRCNKDPYEQAIYWLGELQALGIPVPRLIAQGVYQKFHYMLLNYIPGTELGEIYPCLTDADKKQIAQEVVQFQRQVAALKPDVDCDWPQWVADMLQRARTRIQANGYFSVEQVDRVTGAAETLWDYFETLQPRAYLDDITTKNLLIQNGHVSGIIDVDWLEYGDWLTFVAMTYVSLLNMDCDTVYVHYLLEEMRITSEQRLAFQFYALLFCVDFMGERGNIFMGRRVPVDEQIIARLNSIYETLWQQFFSARP